MKQMIAADAPRLAQVIYAQFWEQCEVVEATDERTLSSVLPHEIHQRTHETGEGSVH